MTPKKALIIISKMCFLISDKADEIKFRGFFAALKTAIEALKKQIPMKVNISIKGTTGWNTKCHCPNCRSFLSKGKYCSECGQALDWGDT